MLIGTFVDTAFAQQADTWWFTPNRPVAIHSGQGLDFPHVGDLDSGQNVMLTGAYVQADDLVWVQLYGTSNYAAVAREGFCEYRSFGAYDPPNREPVSGVEPKD